MTWYARPPTVTSSPGCPPGSWPHPARRSRPPPSYAPTGKAVQTEGGFNLSGRWSFSSGCAHATWVLLGGLVFNEEGQIVEIALHEAAREQEKRQLARIAEVQASAHQYL